MSGEWNVILPPNVPAPDVGMPVEDRDDFVWMAKEDRMRKYSPRGVAG